MAKSYTTDPLVSRDCVIFDGKCDCKSPYYDCKYIDKDNPGWFKTIIKEKEEDE